MKKINFTKLFFSIIICQLAGVIGSFFTVKSISTWYAGLRRPIFSPPNWIFAPTWTILFLLMGISLFLVWRQSSYGKKTSRALFVFFIQLAFNILWSVVFFGLRSPVWAFFEIIVLWIFILISIIFFSRISKPAAWLLLPYILWVSFAAFLNYSFWQLN
jgi:tryptophan-rich sensory protein